MPFQSFQSGCGTCNASTDYADIYYSQDANLAASSVPSGPQTGPGQTGAGKKKRSTKKRTTTKKRTSTKKVSKKKSVGKKKRTMRGGSSESSFQLDDQFIRDNLGISFETVGGATYMPPEYYKGGMLDSLRTGTMAGYDPMDGKLATVGGAKKKRVTKKKTTKKPVKKVTKKKSTKKVSKKKTTKKVASSWKFW